MILGAGVYKVNHVYHQSFLFAWMLPRYFRNSVKLTILMRSCDSGDAEDGGGCATRHDWW
jgi:hypothetical protein